MVILMFLFASLTYLINNHDIYYYVNFTLKGLLIIGLVVMLFVKIKRRKEFDWGLIILVIVFSFMFFYNINEYFDPLYGIRKN